MYTRISSLLIAALLFAVLAGAQPATFSPRGIGGGGALFFPRINPANDNELYVACDMSQLFHSTDFGNSYTQLPFQKLQVLNVSTYEFTNNAAIAYCNFNDGNNGYPVRTDDGGASWTPLPGFDAAQGKVYRMATNYNNPGQLLMNYYGQIVFSNDGGASFSLVKQAANNGEGIIMGGTFFDGSDIWIGTNEGVWHSSNSGATFSQMAATGIPSGEVIWQFAGAKAGAATRFACITAAVTDVYNGVMPTDYYGFAKGVYTMDNAGGTWQSKSAGINFSNDYVMYIGMAWNDVSTIYLAGSDAALNAPLIYKSSNAGSSWSKVFETTNNANITTGWSGYGGDKAWSWGECAFGIAVAPNNAQKVAFGDYSEVHVSSDGGASWKQAYVSSADQHPAGASTPVKQAYHSIGLENTTCWQVSWQAADKMLSAFSDIGMIRSTDSGTSWSFNYTGMSVNSVYRLVHNGAVLFAGNSAVHDMYQSTRLRDAQLDVADNSGRISYSTDNGATWSLMHAFGHPVFWIAADPNDSNTMYASVVHYSGGGAAQGGIYRCTNASALAASTWAKLPDPPRTEGHPASIVVLNDGKVVCTFSGRISSGSTFTPSAGVFLYDPSTGTWADRSDANMQYWTKDIVIDPNDATQNTWYAGVFSGWGALANNRGGLYKTTDRGLSWAKLTGTQFDRVTSITFNPQNGLQAYLSTETQGLWMSSNMSAATPAWTLVSSYNFRQPERVFFNPYNLNEMWVSSFGNGMKMGSLTATGIPDFAQQEKELALYPNPTTGLLNVRAEAGMEGAGIGIYDLSGRLLQSAPVSKQRVTCIDVRTLPPGTYVIRIGKRGGKFEKR